MNRNYKFRVWSTKENKWMFGYEYPNLGGFSLVGETILLGELGRYELDRYFNDFKIMQWTGCKDKAGKEIYEGDYLVDRFPIDEEDLSKGYHERLLPVVWCDKQLMWCVDASFAKDGSCLTSLVKYFGEFLEVKGNIHERS